MEIVVAIDKQFHRTWIIVQWQCEQHCKRRVRPSPKIKGEPSKLQPKYTWNNVYKNSPTYKKGYFQISLVQHSIHGILVVQVLIHFLHRGLGILDKTTQLNSFFSQIKWPLNDSNKRIRDYLFLPNTVITQYNSENQQHMFHRKGGKAERWTKPALHLNLGEGRGGEAFGYLTVIIGTSVMFVPFLGNWLIP